MSRQPRAVDARVVRGASPSAGDWIRRVFPLADGVTYLIAAGVLAVVWIGTDLLDSLAAHLAGAP